jgi:hypothetical protein
VRPAGRTIKKAEPFLTLPFVSTIYNLNLFLKLSPNTCQANQAEAEKKQRGWFGSGSLRKLEAIDFVW